MGIIIIQMLQCCCFYSPRIVIPTAYHLSRLVSRVEPPWWRCQNRPQTTACESHRLFVSPGCCQSHWGWCAVGPSEKHRSGARVHCRYAHRCLYLSIANRSVRSWPTSCQLRNAKQTVNAAPPDVSRWATPPNNSLEGHALYSFEWISLSRSGCYELGPT